MFELAKHLQNIRLQKKPYTAPPQEVTIPSNEYIAQRNSFSSTMNIHNFAEQCLTEQRGSSIYNASNQWLAWYAGSNGIHKLTRKSVG